MYSGYREMSSAIQKSTGGEVGKAGVSDIFMDTRVPYNMDKVVASLVAKLIHKGILSHEEAREIFNSGKSYLH